MIRIGVAERARLRDVRLYAHQALIKAGLCLREDDHDPVLLTGGDPRRRTGITVTDAGA